MYNIYSTGGFLRLYIFSIGLACLAAFMATAGLATSAFAANFCEERFSPAPIAKKIQALEEEAHEAVIDKNQSMARAAHNAIDAAQDIRTLTVQALELCKNTIGTNGKIKLQQSLKSLEPKEKQWDALREKFSNAYDRMNKYRVVNGGTLGETSRSLVQDAHTRWTSSARIRDNFLTDIGALYQKGAFDLEIPAVTKEEEALELPSSNNAK